MRPTKGKPTAKPKTPAVAGGWLADLAEQLDSVIPEDPQKRKAGTIIVRSLIREAVKGDVRAIKEVMRLKELQEKEALRPKPPPTAPPARGRPARAIDLDEITKLARTGMRDITKICRCLGIPKQTAFGPKHAEQVREAFEVGRALFEQDALAEYADDIAHSRRNPLVIFKMKQLGWTDRLNVAQTGGTSDDTAGARERLRALVDQKRKLIDAARRQEATRSNVDSVSLEAIPAQPVEATSLTAEADSDQ